jgi:long-chain acyl-CoA synthetase
MQVESFLEQSAAAYPDKTALVFGPRRLTYRDLDIRANRLAHALISTGVERGDRVIIYLDNSVEAVVSIFAVLKAGGVLVFANPSTKADKLEYILNNCRARAVLTDAIRAPVVESCRSSASALNASLDYAGPDIAPHRRGIDMDLAALIYTSGTMGRPKGVMLTHLNLVSATRSITEYLENTPGDVILDVLPLSFTYGLTQVLTAFYIGCTLVLERSFAYPHAVLNTIAREAVTGIAIVPTISAILLQLNLANYRLSSLRYITNAAAALPVEHIRGLRRALPHVKIYAMHGQTECIRTTYLPPDQIDIRPASVGRGMPNEELYLVDENGNQVAPGGIGEMVVRGSNVMKGYWEMPEETARALRPGRYPWEQVLYTGDLFRMDSEGYLYFVSRSDEIIKTRGEKVSPKEVEEVLYRLDGVAEAAVFGIPDSILGEAVKAVLTLRPGHSLTTREVLQHCAEHMEDFMVPKLVEFRESIPKTPSGKIAKRELAEVAGGVA